MNLRFCIAAAALALALLSAPVTHAATMAELSEEASRLTVAGKYKEALPITREVLARAIKNHGASSKHVATAQQNVGMVLQNLGASAEAEALYLKSLALREKLFSPGDRAVGDSLHQLAAFYSGLGRHVEAEPLIKRALAIRKGRLGREHVDTIISVYVLAEIYRKQGRLAEAEALAKQGIAVCETLGDEGAKYLGYFLSSLGVNYKVQQRYMDAEPVFERALALGEARLGPTHPRLGSRLNNLADLYMTQERYREAALLFERAIGIQEAGYGPKHSEVGVTLYNYGVLQIKQRQLAKALPHLTRALEIFRAAYGVKHPYVAGVTLQLGYILETVGKPERAEKYYKMTAAIVGQTLGSHHPWVRVSYSKLAGINEALGRVDEAAKYEKRLSVMPPAGTRNVRLYYGTNRNALAGETDFGGEVSAGLSLGVGLARVPADEVKNLAGRLTGSLGHLEEATSGRLTEAKTLKVVGVGRAKSRPEFVKGMLGYAGRAATFKNQALVFVHGYNTDFYGALRRATQLSFDLQFDGVLMPFVWPSQGTITGYLTDRQNSKNSVAALVDFLDMLRDEAPGLKVHLLAHSMGNRVLLDALCVIAKRKGDKRHNFGQVIAAHADVSPEEFASFSDCFKERVAGTTLYVNENDVALRARCAALFRCRAGNFARGYKAADVVDTTAMSAGFFRTLGQGFDHDIFVRNPLLFSDITRLLLTGKRPVEARTREFVAREDGDGRGFWAYEKGAEIAVGAAGGR